MTRPATQGRKPSPSGDKLEMRSRDGPLLRSLHAVPDPTVAPNVCHVASTSSSGPHTPFATPTITLASVSEHVTPTFLSLCPSLPPNHSHTPQQPPINAIRRTSPASSHRKVSHIDPFLRKHACTLYRSRTEPRSSRLQYCVQRPLLRFLLLFCPNLTISDTIRPEVGRSKATPHLLISYLLH